MSSPSQPVLLSNHHRNALRQIFQHPAGHNIEWHAVLSLLGAVGSAQQQPGGKAAVTVGSQTAPLPSRAARFRPRGAWRGPPAKFSGGHAAISVMRS